MGFDHWARENARVAGNDGMNRKVRARIAQIQDEIDANSRMIGEAFVAGDMDLAETWAIGVREKQARIAELKNVLKMMGE